MRISVYLGRILLLTTCFGDCRPGGIHVCNRPITSLTREGHGDRSRVGVENCCWRTGVITTDPTPD